MDDILSQLAAPWVGMRLTDDNEVDVAGGQVEPRAEGAEDLDPGLRPQREDCAADAVHHGRPDQVLRLRRRHVHVEVFDLLMKPADKYINDKYAPANKPIKELTSFCYKEPDNVLKTTNLLNCKKN